MTRVPIVVTDLTRMQWERICLAGYRLDEDPPTCVRPVFADAELTERWLFDGDTIVVRLGAIVELDLVRARPDPPHVEDWHVAPGVKVRLGTAVPEAFRSILEESAGSSVASLFGAELRNDHGWHIAAKSGTRSLATIRATRIIKSITMPNQDGPSWRYRLGFADVSGAVYWLPVSDLAMRHFLDHVRERQGSAEAASTTLTTILRQSEAVFLRIGLTRDGWHVYPDRHFLQITGVHTFPDYLDGRCYADFLSEPPSVRWRLPLDEVPF